MLRKIALTYVMCGLALPLAARGEVIGVPGDYRTIQRAINAAQDGDEVVVSDGVWKGLKNKNLDYRGKAMTVRSENGPKNCIIDCEGEGRAFYFKHQETLKSVVDGFTITDGGDGFGSGIRCDSSSPTIRNCVITNGAAGGIACYRSNASIVNTTITNGLPPGIYCYRSSPTITGCTISGNDYGEDDQWVRGGGIACYENSNPIIRQCTITLNEAYESGGGIGCDNSSPTITDCTIRDNRGRYSGGGVFCYENSHPTITRCDISENTAPTGGGVFIDRDSDPTFIDCRISNNIATERWPRGRAGVYCNTSDAQFIGCVITENTGGPAVGLGSGNPRFTDCEISDNEWMGVSWGGNNRDGGGAIFSGCTIVRNGFGGFYLSGQGSLLIADCVIAGNHSAPGLSGGGITYGSRGDVTIANCSITDNSTDRSGAGISSGDGKLFVVNSTISNNRAGQSGGGLGWWGGEKTVVNCVIMGNTAIQDGAGVYAAVAGSHLIANCTIAANKAGGVGGGVSTTRGSNTMLANSILWDNVAEAGSQIAVRFDRDPASLTVSYSDVQGGKEGVYVEEGSELHWKEGNIDADPRFVDPETNDFRLGAGSPSIDAADNFAVPRGVTADLDGLVRFHDDPDTPDTGRGKPPIVDMGAYEFGSPPPCTGADKLRAKCRIWRKASRIKAVVRHGQPGAILTFRLDADPDSDTYAVVTETGQARVAFKDLPAGRHVVELIECDLRRKAKCP